MKIKTIDKMIGGKMCQFLKSIEDKDLRNDVKNCLAVTGGCITSLLQREPVNDYDVYLSDMEVTKRLAVYYAKRFPELDSGDYSVLSGADIDDQVAAEQLGVSLFEDQVKVFIQSVGVVGNPESGEPEEAGEDPQLKPDAEEDTKAFEPVFISANAITLSGKVQIITRFVGTASEIHKNFDFVHAFNYWTFKEGLVLNVESLSAVIGKELIYRGSKYPLASIIRTRKFIKRGWTINAGQYLKMCIQLNSMDLLDPAVLEEQLVGVDSTYFAWFLTELEKAIKDAGGAAVDATYVVHVIEKVFG